MYTGEDMRSIIAAQLALEYNCSPADFSQPANKLTLPVLHEGRRRFSEALPFFKMAVMGHGAVLMADSSLHSRLEEYVKDKEGHLLFEHHHLRKIEKMMKGSGKCLWQTHHMFLPKYPTEAITPVYPLRWFEGEDLRRFYPGRHFPNALCDRFIPERPDVLAVAAHDSDVLIGMAGCSADTPLLWQIGVDIHKAYRGRGLGAALVGLLKNEIERRGKIPYYGTSLSNLPSWSIALGCGFRPVWIEVGCKEG